MVSTRPELVTGSVPYLLATCFTVDPFQQFSIAGIMGTVSSLFSKPKQSEYHDIVKRLYELGHSTDQLANSLLALMVVSGTELSLGMFTLLCNPQCE